LNQWLQQLEIYFGVHEVSKAHIISFVCLKLEGHALMWWESDAIAGRLWNEPLVIEWEMFKEMIKLRFYPIGYK
jgi:hypothetical protein